MDDWTGQDDADEEDDEEEDPRSRKSSKKKATGVIIESKGQAKATPASCQALHKRVSSNCIARTGGRFYG
ncbi:hypothetical protein JVT61DRAFT_12567 [Boletus reticuloceps]|uniref:Uncharacterized protein n=1 Tax=Boletus reticuloceps TaxID=495285 RepID=A0A8I2YDS4_9AGAM|nr:hypothetical protein JVT61DRAFT_12567 [Boletus reticuloceps]